MVRGGQREQTVDRAVAARVRYLHALARHLVFQQRRRRLHVALDARPVQRGHAVAVGERGAGAVQRRPQRAQIVDLRGGKQPLARLLVARQLFVQHRLQRFGAGQVGRPQPLAVLRLRLGAVADQQLAAALQRLRVRRGGVPRELVQQRAVVHAVQPHGVRRVGARLREQLAQLPERLVRQRFLQ